ncbi:MAG: hypothetical protein ABSF63_03960 [Candidatus Bathyarchaeia archaeon]
MNDFNRKNENVETQATNQEDTTSNPLPNMVTSGGHAGLTTVKSLQERINQLNPGQTPELTTPEANAVRWFWIQLNYTPEEAEEDIGLRKRKEILYENWLAHKSLPGEQDEWTKIESRLVELIHDIVMPRAERNSALRDRVWPELTGRVLRWHKLGEKPSEQLTGDEVKELGLLTAWFDELQREALAGSTWR